MTCPCGARSRNRVKDSSRAGTVFNNAPDETLFAGYRKKGLKWDAFEPRFLDIMATRKIEDQFDPKALEGACLLCSEDTPHNCHRRLVIEYLEDRWGQSLDVTHL